MRGGRWGEGDIPSIRVSATAGDLPGSRRFPWVAARWEHSHIPSPGLAAEIPLAPEESERSRGVCSAGGRPQFPITRTQNQTEKRFPRVCVPQH